MMMRRISVSNPPPMYMIRSFHCSALLLATHYKRGNGVVSRVP